LERELDQARRLSLLGTLASSIAHEFNNILTPVLGYAEMAKTAPEDAELCSKALEKVVGGVEHASSLAETILSLSGSANSQPGGCASPRDCAAAATRFLPKSTGLEIDIQIPDALTVQMEPAALTHVLLNLLLNATAAMRARSGRITVRGFTWNEYGQLEVEDSGCGIAPGFLPHVFESFATSSARTGRAGSGLGLSISRQLIERAGGSITVQSKVGSGSCFSIRLPLAKSGAAAAA
jgi:two-component system cell cycle sensor histidine kinase/response regulator CckA